MARTTTRGEARAHRRRSGERGFGMLWALMCVALIGIYLMQVGEVWTTQVRRTREDELLRRGDAIRGAIEQYVKAEKNGEFPKTFDDLLHDSRALFTRRFLRDAYTDPMTGDDWEIVRGQSGELYGVYSKSTEKP